MINHTVKYVVSLGTIFALVGCQMTTQPQPKVTPPTPKIETKKPAENTPDGVKITPYDRPEIKREHIPVIIPQQKVQTQVLDDGQNNPAFKQLMQQTQLAFQKGQFDEAEKSALHAQRLAPQSADTFLYLARIAHQKKQYANAESLSRRGLTFAQSATQQKAFWNVILLAGQQQKNQQTVAEALRHLKD